MFPSELTDRECRQTDQSLMFKTPKILKMTLLSSHFSAANKRPKKVSFREFKLKAAFIVLIRHIH